MTASSHDDDAGDWTRRIIVGTTLGIESPPTWLRDAYAVFHANVVDEDYPCFFGSQAENRGALYYSYARSEDVGHLPQTLQTFLRACPTIQRDRNNLVLFLEPEPHPTHQQHRQAFWRILRYLRAHDPHPAPQQRQVDPSDPRWEFTFADREFFVVGASPTYYQHRSRNLGPCLLMLFQPREVFGSEGDARTRRLIRERAQRWDGTAAHPDLNTYGQPGNREWAQYFISDDNSPATGRCPLFHGTRSAEAQAEPDKASSTIGIPHEL